MKIQCDVCDKEEATVFCSADEAALCDDCDRRVHHANKLASKHNRYYLLHPAFKESPLCDICQERRALLFCQEDRAILCRECDLPIHKSNEHTQKHNRFLLTRVKLSAFSSSFHASSSSSGSFNSMINTRLQSPNQSSSLKKQSSFSNEFLSPSSVDRTIPTSNPYQDGNPNSGETGSIPTSSISEYLIETLPGWRVDEFLDPSSSASNGYFKIFDHRLPIVDRDFGSDTSTSASKNVALYVPQAPPQQSHIPNYLPRGHFYDGVDWPGKVKNGKSSRKRNDDGFYGSSYQDSSHQFLT